MPQPTISVALATFNESANIARCLESVKGLADEIIVVDGSSSDNTVEIAKTYNAKVVVTENHPIFHINKNKAIDAATCDWILQMDADECVSPELLQEIKSVISDPKNPNNGFWTPRLNYFLGCPLRKGGQYPDYTLRLYRRGKGRLPAKDVHEQATVDGKVDYLVNNLLHYNTPDFDNYLLRSNRYTSLLATELGEKNVPINTVMTLGYLFVKPALEFLTIFVRHKGYQDGFPGMVFALFSGLRYGLAYIKYWQIKEYPDDEKT